MLVIPKGTDFCINARLRRVCLLDSPPGPFVLERSTGSLLQFARMVNYLDDTFPIGTPLEELDIDIIGGLTSGTFRRPVVALWGLRLGEELVVASGRLAGCLRWRRATRQRELQALSRGVARYAARRIPTRGVAVAARARRAVRWSSSFDTCFGTSSEGGGLVVTSSNASVSPLFRVVFDPGRFDIGGTKTLSSAQIISTRTQALETTTLERDRAAGHDAAYQRLELAGGVARCE